MTDGNATHEVVELPQRHLRADFLAHRDKSDPDDREGLEGIILRRLLGRSVFVFLCLMLLNVLVAIAQELLNLQHITGPCERTHVDKNSCELRHWVLDRLQRRYCRVSAVLET